MKRLLHPLSLFVITLLAAGCASAPVKETVRIWPDPPEDPKIAFVRTFTGASDFSQASIADSFLGKRAAADMKTPYSAYRYKDKIYVALSRQGIVMVLDVAEKIVSFVGDRDEGSLIIPLGVAVAADGTIFVCDQKQQKILVYDPDGTYKRSIGNKEELVNPISISLNNDLKRLYVADSRGHVIRVYSFDGSLLFSFGKRGKASGEFNYPTGVEVDRRNGNVVVADSQNFQVQIFDKDGKFLRKFGEAGDGTGAFGAPKSIGIDTEGHIYVTDGLLQNFQIFDENGQVLIRISGGGGRGVLGSFSTPGDIYVDEQDRIYLPDQTGGKVLVYQYMSDTWKKTNPEEFAKYIALNEKRLQDQADKDKLRKEKADAEKAKKKKGRRKVQSESE